MRPRLGRHTPSSEDLLKEAIKNKMPLSKFEPKDLTYDLVKRLTNVAIDHENVDALLFFAQIRPYAVRDVLGNNFKIIMQEADKGNIKVANLFFQLRGVIDEKRRKLFRFIAARTIIRASFGLAGQKIGGDILKKTDYRPEVDFDLEETIERIIDLGTLKLRSTTQIVGIERIEREKNCILIMDVSGSISGDRNVMAAIATAIAAHNLRNDSYGVIVFSDDAIILKSVTERKNPIQLIEEILDLAPTGFTNIENGLEAGLTELNQIRGATIKWAVLITDGNYNRGKDPTFIASRYPRLHVIHIPGQIRGERICKRLARVGKGKYAKLNLSKIPFTLRKLLRES
ncbi:MAG: VWA domain-containing protein [Candidatus Heimdallarchaeota archaeon]